MGGDPHKEFFNRLAETLGQSPPPEEKDQKLRQILNSLGIAPDALVLDVGCGAGRLFHLLSPLLSDGGQLIGLDFAIGMLRRAQEKKGPSAFLICGDICWMPLPGGICDCILGFAVFPHIPDKRAAVREFYRVLKPGGWVAIFHLMGRRELNAFHQKAHGVICKDRLPSDRQMRRLFESAGFSRISIEDRPERYVLRAFKSPSDPTTG